MAAAFRLAMASGANTIEDRNAPLPAEQHRTDGRLYVGSVAADIDLEALGLLDGLEGEARTERAELIAWLLDRGFSIDQIRASVAPLLLPANRGNGRGRGLPVGARNLRGDRARPAAAAAPARGGRPAEDGGSRRGGPAPSGRRGRRARQDISRYGCRP